MRQGKDIINRYNTYLRLEKSLSANSIDAYLTDLDKLLRFAEDEKKDVKEISYDGPRSSWEWSRTLTKTSSVRCT